MQRHWLKRRSRWQVVSCATLVIVLVAGLVAQLGFSPASGALLGRRSLQLSSDEIGGTTDYQLSFSLSSAGPLGSIAVQFCSNDPVPGNPCTAPTGFDASAAVLSNQSGATGFSISAASTANQIILTRPVANATAVAASYHFQQVTNPSVPGSYYVRLQTYGNTTATGQSSDYGGIAFAVTNALAITAEVPPYLIFCTAVTIDNLNCANASGDYIDFGELSASQTRNGSSQMLVATNAQGGYVVSTDGTTLTSGTNVINALASNDVSRPGTAQFGFNLQANTTPKDGNNPAGPGISQPTSNYNQANSYRFAPGDTVVTNAVPDNVRVFTISYIVNVPPTQSPGVYVSTITYVCLANF